MLARVKSDPKLDPPGGKRGRSTTSQTKTKERGRQLRRRKSLGAQALRIFVKPRDSSDRVDRDAQSSPDTPPRARTPEPAGTSEEGASLSPRKGSWFKSMLNKSTEKFSIKKDRLEFVLYSDQPLERVEKKLTKVLGAMNVQYAASSSKYKCKHALEGVLARFLCEFDRAPSVPR